MIHAAIHGKPTGIDREDGLTAAVFGRLRYLRPEVLANWLAKSTPWKGASTLPPLLPAGAPDVSWWPRWPDTLRKRGHVEPDLMLSFRGQAVVIEAKLWSGKSGGGADDKDDSADQLAREWKSVCDFLARETKSRVVAHGLIYVTAHLTLPTREFEESEAVLHEHGMTAPLYWLPWSSLGPLLEHESELDGQQFPFKLIAADLLSYLRHVGVLRFSGWRLPAIGIGETTWTYSADVPRPYWDGPTLEVPPWRYTHDVPKYFARVPAEVNLNAWCYERGQRATGGGEE